MSRYIGDVLFERLNDNPNFLEGARKLIASDWREGTSFFRNYVTPYVDDIIAAGGFEAWGDVSLSYLERRVMEDFINPKREPWLWAYANLTGAHVDPDTVRAALNNVASR